MADDSVNERAPLVFRTSSVSVKTDNRTQFQRRLAVWSILLAVGFERLAFYSLAGNLVLFLTSNSIGWSSFHSITALLSFLGTSYASAIIFSWISDAKLGRAKTILIGFVLYIGGYVFIPLFAKENIFKAICDGRPDRREESGSYWKEKCSIPMTAVLVVIAIGVGAVQANMAIFGAEQHREQRDTTEYFDKYYAAVNIGGFLASFIIAYVQQNIDWFIGHVVSTTMLAITFLLFLIGFRYYTHVKPHDSVITNFFPVLINAFQTWRNARRIIDERRSSSKLISLREQEDESDDLSHEMNANSISFFDYAKGVNDGRFQDRVVDDIKSLGRITVVFLLLIPYWIIYLQSDTTFILQAVHMKIPSFTFNKHHVPIVWLSLTDEVIIILTIFILNTCVYKHLYTKNRPFSMKVRIIIGMICATLSMCITGVIEIVRQKRCDSPFHQTNQTIGHATYIAADMSIFYQFPQYLTIALSEVFTSIASMEFAYLAAPQSAQSLVMSMRFTSAGLSSFLGSGYITIYKTIDQNFTMTNTECKNDKQPELFYIYFFVLAGIQFFFIFIFLACDHKYQILKISQHRFNTCLFIRSATRLSNP